MPEGPTQNDVQRELERAQQRVDADQGDDDEQPVSLADLRVEWREAAPEERPEGMSWDAESGVLAYDVWEAQQDALAALAGDGDGDDHAHDLVALLAGYGSGKSLVGARWLLANALAYPGGHFLAMGTTFSEARTSTFEKLFEQLPGERTALRTSSFNGPESSPLVADYNRAEHRLTLVNDAVITLGSADKWSRFAGSEFSAVWCDEPSHYGSDLHDLLEMLGSRLRGVDGPKVMFWTLTGNGYNAAHTILEQREDSTGEPIGLDIELIRASTLENPYLDEADKDRFARQYGGTAREEQALYGGFAAAQGLVYSAFRRDIHVIPHTDAVGRIQDGWRVYGYDAGWNDPRVVLEVGKTGYEQLVVLDEFYESDTHVEDAIGWLRDRNKPEGPIFAEHEPSDIQKFNDAGYPAEKADKSLDAGIAEVRRRLEADGNAPVDESPGPQQAKGFMVTRRAGGTKSRRRITSTDRRDTDDAPPDRDREGRVGLLVSENCPHLIREFLGYKEEHVGTSQAVDHCLDGLRYLCMGVVSGSQPASKSSGTGTWGGTWYNP
jgi:hypothetical protein